MYAHKHIHSCEPIRHYVATLTSTKLTNSQICRYTLLLHAHHKCLGAHIQVLPREIHAHTCKHKKHARTYARLQKYACL